MKYFLLFIATMLFFGCGSTKKTNDTPKTNAIDSVNHSKDIITKSDDNDTTNMQSTEKPPLKPNGFKEEATVEKNSTDSSKDVAKPIIDDGSGVINNQDTEKPYNNLKPVKANIQKVSFTGDDGNYDFSVAIKSDETGCDQYADWWEVISADGILLYRRVLGHSHPKEQPFTRSGGSVDIKKTEKVYVRAHMNNEGYTGNTFVGSIENGFISTKEPITFSKNIELQDPLPQNCAF